MNSIIFITNMQGLVGKSIKKLGLQKGFGKLIVDLSIILINIK